jgi:hypothetical protein
MTTNSGLVFGSGATALSGALAGTETVQVDNGGAVKVTATVQQIANLWSGAAQVDAAFATSSFTAGQTITLSGARTFTGFHGTQTATSLTINLPTTPLTQGQIAGFSIDAAVTTLTVASNKTILNAPSTASTASAGSAFAWVYNVADTSWYRRQ